MLARHRHGNRKIYDYLPLPQRVREQYQALRLNKNTHFCQHFTAYSLNNGTMLGHSTEWKSQTYCNKPMKNRHASYSWKEAHFKGNGFICISVLHSLWHSQEHESIFFLESVVLITYSDVTWVSWGLIWYIMLLVQQIVQASNEENIAPGSHRPFVRGIHRWQVILPQKGPAMRKVFPCNHEWNDLQ